MDPVIQGLTQSAIVQKLSETEHNVKRFTHDIPDNAPYRSFDKVEVVPHMGTSHPDSTNYFKIPRRGYLNRMYLKVIMRWDIGAEKNATFLSPGSEQEHGAEFFANFFTSARLLIGGKCVETLYGENILYNAFTTKGGCGEGIARGLGGIKSQDDPELRGLADDFYQGTDEHHYFTFLIPLDFSIMKFHKDALDTLFLNEMEVVFEKRSLFGYQNVVTKPSLDDNRTVASLVCMYHNLHPHFKNQIRNTNFQRETSTLLTTGSYLVTELPKREEIAAVPLDYGATPVIYGFPHYGRLTYDLQLDMFATDILITFRKESDLSLYGNPTIYEKETTGDIHALPVTGRLTYIRFKLMANNRVLYDKQAHETIREIHTPSSLDVQDQATLAQGHDSYNIVADALQAGGASLPLENPRSTIGRGGSSLYRIPLTLFDTDEFLNGGLDMKSLTNVRLIIENVDFFRDPFDVVFKNFTASVVIRHKNVTRVDGKTGSVSVV